MLTKAEINLIKSLDDKKNRDAMSLFVAEGPKIVGELLTGKYTVDTLYYTDNCRMSVWPAGYRGRTERVSETEMKRISRLKTPSSVLALVRKPHFRLEPEDLHGELAIALDGLQDPGNLGTIIRLADWFGIRHVVCSDDSVDCYNGKVIQATMGAVFRVKVHYPGFLPDFLNRAKQAGIVLYGTFLEGECIYDAVLSPSGIIVLGNEGHGISKAVSEQVDRKLFIPPFPQGIKGSESLNVGVAAAVVCSEFRRRML